MSATTADATLFGVCEHCGEPLDPGVRYPVSVRDDGDAVKLFSFCGDACQAAWEAHQDR